LKLRNLWLVVGSPHLLLLLLLLLVMAVHSWGPVDGAAACGRLMWRLI
jgi:hypothetical protein